MKNIRTRHSKKEQADLKENQIETAKNKKIQKSYNEQVKVQNWTS